MPRLAKTDRYLDLIKRAESHYERQGFVKWADLAHEIGVSRQRILQMMQHAVCQNLLTGADLDRYRSTSSRLAASRSNEEMRRKLRKRTIQVNLLPDNYTWLEEVVRSAPNGTTRGDLINTALNHYRRHINA